jgi:hypothetical protein
MYRNLIDGKKLKNIAIPGISMIVIASPDRNA